METGELWEQTEKANYSSIEIINAFSTEQHRTDVAENGITYTVEKIPINTVECTGKMPEIKAIRWITIDVENKDVPNDKKNHLKGNIQINGINK